MAELELRKPSAPVAEGTSPRKHSIDMVATPIQQHQLEWHVTRFTVGSGKGKKSILNSIGACIGPGCGPGIAEGGKKVGRLILIPPSPVLKSQRARRVAAS